MIDIDGRTYYSHVVAINVKKGQNLMASVYPNPFVKGRTQVLLGAAQNGTVYLRLYDLSGKMLLKQSKEVHQGTNTLELEKAPAMKPGIYILEIRNQQEVIYIKLMIAAE